MEESGLLLILSKPRFAALGVCAWPVVFVPFVWYCQSIVDLFSDGNLSKNVALVGRVLREKYTLDPLCVGYSRDILFTSHILRLATGDVS